jgi:adenylate cyclase
VLAMIAMAIGSVVMVARHLDSWTRPADGDKDPLPAHRMLAITLAQPFQLLEWKVYDFIHAFGAKTPPDPEVVVLGIDEASLSLEDSSAFPEDIAGSRPLQLMDEVYPWSREVYAHLIERLVEGGARTVVIDLLFPASHGRHPEGDDVLRRCLDKYRKHVVLAADVISGGIQNGQNEMVQLPFNQLIEHRWPPDERIGFVSYWPDTDGVIRETRFRYSQDPALPEKTLHSLSASVLRSQGLGDRFPEDTEFHHVRFGDSTNYEPFSLHEIFVPSLWESNFGSGKQFAGKTIFLGPVASQEQDFHITPVGRIAGVKVHAHVFAAAKAGQLLQALPQWVAPLLIAAAAALAWVLTAFSRRPVLAMFVLVSVAVLCMACQWLLFNHAAVVVDASTPVLAFGMIGICGFTYDFLLERRQKHALKRSVMRFHSPDVAEQIVQHPETYYSIREGASRNIVVLFSDIRGYTGMSEQLTAQEMVTQLNQYFQRMVSVVFARQGAVDKFIGDAMMAVWGRFRDDPAESELAEDAIHAVDAALAMRAELTLLNAGWRANRQTELAIGIGIHQGEAVVGEIGSEERAELTAIGDSVNLGSRLEGATKDYGLDLLVSEPVRRRCGSRFRFRSVDLVRVKGKNQPVEVFTVLGTHDAPAPSGLDPFETGMVCYRQGRFEDALDYFKNAAAEGMDDDLTELFKRRCTALIERPPESWDGVYIMTHK